MNQQTQQNAPRRILRAKEVHGIGSLTGLSKSSIYVFIGKGDFPAPVSLGARAVGWWSDQVENWINTRPAPVVTQGGYKPRKLRPLQSSSASQIKSAA